MSPIPPIKYDPYDRVTQRQLPNGARHWHYTHPGTSRFVAEIIVSAGSRYDPPDAPGLAHLTEHLVSKNGDVPYGEAAEWFRSVGSWQSGWCGLRSAGYGFSVLSEESVIQRAFSIWRPMLAGPVTKGFEHEAAVIKSELASKIKVQFVEEMMRRRRLALFGSHPIAELRDSVIGKPEILAGLSAERAESFRASLYVANRITVITAGDDLSVASRLVNEFCAGFPEGAGFSEKGLPLCVCSPVFGASPSFREDVCLTDTIGAGGSLSSGRLEAVALVPPHYLSDVAASVLRDEAARIIRQEKGWAYAVELSSDGSWPDYLTKVLEVTVADPANLDVVERTLGEIADSFWSREDLFRNEIHKRRLALRLLDKRASDMVDSLSDDAAQIGRPESFRELDATYEAFTFGEYQDWCRRYFRAESFAWWLIRP